MSSFTKNPESTEIQNLGMQMGHESAIYKCKILAPEQTRESFYLNRIYGWVDTQMELSSTRSFEKLTIERTGEAFTAVLILGSL